MIKRTERPSFFLVRRSLARSFIYITISRAPEHRGRWMGQHLLLFVISDSLDFIRNGKKGKMEKWEERGGRGRQREKGCVSSSVLIFKRTRPVFLEPSESDIPKFEFSFTRTVESESRGSTIKRSVNSSTFIRNFERSTLIEANFSIKFFRGRSARSNIQIFRNLREMDTRVRHVSDFD